MNKEELHESRKGPKKETSKNGRIAIRLVKWLAVVVIAFVILVQALDWLITHPAMVNSEFLNRPMGGSAALDPTKIELSDIKDQLEAIPALHLPIPDSSGKNEGFMRVVTGEGSANVRAIPDHPGLYQIDITRYGVVYDNLPSQPRTRNYLTMLLTLGTEFNGHRWNLVDLKASSADEISKPGQTTPSKSLRESLPKEEAEWFAQPVIDFLNGSPFDEEMDSQHAAGYMDLHTAFERQAAIRGAIQDQGIRLPQ